MSDTFPRISVGTRMIVDGRALAEKVLARTRARAEQLPHPPRVLALVASETLATKSYLAIKQKKAEEAGCSLTVQHIKSSLRPLEVFDMATAMVRESDADAIIVQLPLPEGVDAKAACDVIPVEKDADVLSSAARAAFKSGSSTSGVNAGSRTPGVFPPLLPPVVGAVREIFVQNGIQTKGKKAVVIGAGFLVGAPVATWLTQQGAEVKVATIETNLKELVDALRAADIVVSGAGSPHFIKPEMLKQGVVLIDAGASDAGRLPAGRQGRVAGDADPACAETCSLFTPVPGGVGPLAVAKLFENVTTLAERSLSKGRQ